MIKLKYRYLTIFFVLFTVSWVSAQGRSSLIVWGEGGYTNMFNDADNIKSLGRAGFGIGGGYEWRKKSFIIHAGAEFVQFNSVLQMDDFIYELALTDTEGDPYTGKFYFSDNKDRYQLGYINIPVMLGLHFNKFYFMAGGKTGFNVYGKSKMDYGAISAGDYPQFIEDFENMPNHFFDENKVKSSSSVKTKINFALSAEAGISLRSAAEKKSNISYRLAVFCDYGLVNIRDNSYAEDLILDRGNGMPYQPGLNSFIRTAELKDKHLNTLFTGLKFTVVFNLGEKRGCNCLWE